MALIWMNSIATFAQLDQGNLYDNCSKFEAFQAFLDGEKNIGA